MNASELIREWQAEAHASIDAAGEASQRWVRPGNTVSLVADGEHSLELSAGAMSDHDEMPAIPRGPFVNRVRAAKIEFRLHQEVMKKRRQAESLARPAT